MANAVLFSTGTELRHLHRLVTRIAAAGAGASALALFVVGFVTREGHFFAEAVGPTIVAISLSVLIVVGREHAAVVFAMATLSVILAHGLVGTPSTTVAATTAIVVMGCLSILFIQRHIVAYVVGGVTVNLLAPVFWSGRLDGSLSTGLVMALSFLVGSIAFLLVRNAAASVNTRYRTVFELAPVALIELNWERCLAMIEELAPTSVEHLESMLRSDRSLLASLVERIEIVRANAAAARLIGVASSDRLLGRVSIRFMSDDLAPTWTQQILAVWQGRAEHQAEVHVELAGQERWLAITSMAADVEDRSVMALSDVSASRLLEQSLTELIQSKDQFIASVSHELRTPLTAVVGLASELAGPTSMREAERQELLDVLADQSVEMSHIVEDLLVAARADTGTITVASEPVDLAVEARELISHLDPAVEYSGIVSAVAMADRVRIRQILRNLLVNASRYGGDRRRVVVATDQHCITVEMRDNGEPLGEDERTRIFQPYERAHHEAGVTAAVGLGLSVSQRLAELMGGTLDYDHDGETVFRLTLPARPAGAATLAPAAASSSA